MKFVSVFLLLSLAGSFAAPLSNGMDGMNGIEALTSNDGNLNFNCFAQKGYKLGIFGASGSTGMMSDDAPLQMLEAKYSEMEINLHIDPCFSCGNAK